MTANEHALFEKALEIDYVLLPGSTITAANQLRNRHCCDFRTV